MIVTLELSEHDVAVLMDALNTAATTQRYSRTMTNMDSSSQTVELQSRIYKAIKNAEVVISRDICEHDWAMTDPHSAICLKCHVTR